MDRVLEPWFKAVTLQKGEMGWAGLGCCSLTACQHGTFGRSLMKQEKVRRRLSPASSIRSNNLAVLFTVLSFVLVWSRGKVIGNTRATRCHCNPRRRLTVLSTPDRGSDSNDISHLRHIMDPHHTCALLNGTRHSGRGRPPPLLRTSLSSLVCPLHIRLLQHRPQH